MDGKFIDKLCNDSLEYLYLVDSLEYLYLVSLISSDNILTKEDAEKSLKIINETFNAIDESTVSEDKKQEMRDYLNKGIDIIKQDIEYFEKENKQVI